MTKKPGLKARSKSIKAAMAAAKGGDGRVINAAPSAAKDSAPGEPKDTAPVSTPQQTQRTTTGRAASSLFPSAEDDVRILSERADIYARPPKLKREAKGRDAFVQVRLGTHGRYGIPFAYADEIIPQTEPTPVPGTPNFVAGVVNLRGTLLTVVDLGLFLGVGGIDTVDDARIVVVGGEGTRFGALVAGVDGSQFYDPDTLSAPLSGSGEKNASHVSGIHDGKVAVLDMSDLLSAPMLIVDQG